ncbi:MAG: MoxR family ATPase [Crenarchaeota archaeon]|nr:MoxR family ATPase [Thermoproteota archaeon]
MYGTNVSNYLPYIRRIVGQICSYFVIRPEIIVKILAALLSNSHILFEDYPGLGKTLLAKIIAKVLGCEFKRVQFTPDLLPADIIGTKVWVPGKGKFKLVKGPIFTNILLADEINRAPPKTQAALLEAMEERQVTIEGRTYKLEQPFIVLATQNPIEMEGTYPLPEALLDRFGVKISIGYPQTLEEEVEILRRRLSWRKDDPTEDIAPVVTREGFLKLQMVVEENIYIDKCILEYIANIVRTIRNDPRVLAGPSPRGAIVLMKLSKAVALMFGRSYVIPDDVLFIAREALSHRVILRPEYSEETTPEDVVSECIRRVPVPKVSTDVH